MQYFIKVTKNAKTTRMVVPNRNAAEALRQMLNNVAEVQEYTVDQRVYEYNGVLHREPAEVNTAARILRQLTKQKA